MGRPSSFVLAIALTSMLVACSDSTAVKPASPSNATGGPVDTTGVVPGFVNLKGHVFAIQATPAAQGSDTLRYIPIAGVSLRLMHNILVNGQAAQELAGTTVSGVDGEYTFSGIPGGYYVLYAEPSVGSGYAGAYSLVPALRGDVAVDVFVWKR